MVSLAVFNKSGKQVGTVDIDPAEIAPRISKQLMHDAVVMYQANTRQGSHRTKSRAEVAGSTKKMYRQKGTGNARAGSRRSGVRVGGGHIFAIRPRDYSYSLPRKALQAATRMAIATKIKDQKVLLIDELSLAAPKSKEMAAILGALKLGGQSVHVATAALDKNVYLSTRNLDRVTISPVAELNALSVLRPMHLVMTKAALEAIRAKAAEQKKPASAAQ